MGHNPETRNPGSHAGAITVSDYSALLTTRELIASYCSLVFHARRNYESILQQLLIPPTFLFCAGPAVLLFACVLGAPVPAFLRFNGQSAGVPAPRHNARSVGPACPIAAHGGWPQN